MLPTDAKARKDIPICSGFLDYFPDAIAAIAELSRIGNEQHNPGKPLHWDRSKSGDESDALMRHFMQRGTVDTDGVRHSTKVAWRALALLQKEMELAAGSLKPEEDVPWIEHNGGECPINPAVRVDVKTRGCIAYSYIPAGWLRWKDVGNRSDIECYRISP